MLLTYFLSDFEMVPVAPIITGITSVFTFHMRCISIVRSLYFRIFSASLLLLLLLLLSSSSSSSSSLLSPSWMVFTIIYPKQPCCSCSVFTVCAACNVISSVKYVLYFYISTSRSMCAVHNMALCCSSLISCFPAMLLAQVSSEWFWNGSSRLYYYSYHFYFRLPYGLNFCYEVCIFSNLLRFFLGHISVSWNCNIY
jgi:hypothetical protein